MQRSIVRCADAEADMCISGMVRDDSEIEGGFIGIPVEKRCSR
jgi:hypothetical protein